MTLVGYTDVQLDIFSGLNTDYSAPNLPPGASPDCQDIAFELAGAVKTRPGLLAKLTDLSGTCNYIKTYSPVSGTIKTLTLDSSGNLRQETADGVDSVIASNIHPNAYGKSITLFDREYIAISDGKFGIDIPLQFDGTNLDRVSQVGPGDGPTVITDDAPVIAVTSISPESNFSISAISEVGNVVTITTTIAHPFTLVNGFILIFGVATAGYNGIFQIATIPDSTHLTVVNPTTGLGADTTGQVALALVRVLSGSHGLTVGDVITLTGNAGTLNNNQNQTTNTPTPATWQVVRIINATTFDFSLTGLTTTSISFGNGGVFTKGGKITAGTHSVAISFVTRQGYITRPSPIVQWTSTGNKSATVQGLPNSSVGTNIVETIILVTPAGQGTFLYIPQAATLPGNVLLFNGQPAPPIPIPSTVKNGSGGTFTLNFTDAQLTAFGLSGQQFFTKDELGEVAGFFAYNERLGTWGERNKIPNFQNLTFDGGSRAGSANQPTGWSTIQGNVPGATLVSGRYGSAFQILGDGATFVQGFISQSAFLDSLNNPILQINTSYSVRVKVKQVGNPLSGRFNINLSSVIGGFTTVGIQVVNGQAPTGSFLEFIAPILTPQASIPTDLTLQVFTDNNLSLNQGWAVDDIQIFPTATPFNDSIVRISLPSDPENFDGVSGLVEVSPQDGQRITCCIVNRERLRVMKERSSYSTADTGNSEPAEWSVTVDSFTKGSSSINGVDIGEDWYLMADRSGVHISDGGEPIKISQEIQTAPIGSNNPNFWDNINWNFGHTIWLTIDIIERRAYVGVPLGSATTPNKTLVLDFRGLESFGLISTSPSVHQSAYSGKTFTVAKGRRWVPWVATGTAGAMVERFDGTRQLLIGNGVGNGKVYLLKEGQFSDDGVAINSFYTTYAFLDEDQETQYQLGGHLKIFPYITGFVEGSGSFNMQAFRNSLLNIAVNFPIAPLSNPAFVDFERPINVNQASRAFFRFSTNAVGAWFRLERLTPTVGKDPVTLRGI